MGAERARRLQVLVPESLHEELVALAAQENETKSDIVREALQRMVVSSKSAKLTFIAARLAPMYEANKEQTVFTALDGEEFI